MRECLCTICEYCRDSSRVYNKRREYYCAHPNSKYIYDYFKSHNISKSPGFIGFSQTDGSFPIKKTPKWCPIRVGETVTDNPCKQYSESNPESVNDHEHGCDEPCQESIDFRNAVLTYLEQISKDFDNLLDILKGGVIIE